MIDILFISRIIMYLIYKVKILYIEIETEWEDRELKCFYYVFFMWKEGFSRGLKMG